jgi:RNA polymerase sigma-70 factor (ECF subfamily)
MERIRGGQSVRTKSRWTRARVADALAGDTAATSELVTDIGHLIRSRVQRRLRRSGVLRSIGESRFDVQDLCQDVFARLFERDGRILRSWDPDRGLSLANYVGLVAERLVGGLLRTRRVHLESATEAQKLASLREATVDAPRVACTTEHRQLLDRLKRTLAARLSEKGMAVYQLLFIEELSVEDVEARLALNASAIYTWRHRIRSQLAQVQAQLDGVHESGWPQHTRRAARAA